MRRTEHLQTLLKVGPAACTNKQCVASESHGVVW